jgi:hypothetical protein
MFFNIIIYIEQPGVAVTLCTFIREMFGLIFGRNSSGYPDIVFPWFSPVLPGKCRDRTSISLRSLPETLSNSSIIVPVDVI